MPMRACPSSFLRAEGMRQLARSARGKRAFRGASGHLVDNRDVGLMQPCRHALANGALRISGIDTVDKQAQQGHENGVGDITP